MKSDDLENELRNLKFAHLTERELTAYCDQALDQIGRARVQAHLKQCFICERQLALLLEENAALGRHQVSAEDAAFVDQLMERVGLEPVKTGEMSIRLRERLAEYLRQMVESWQAYFGRGALRGEADQGEQVWQWQSQDGALRASAAIEKNADLTISFTSNEMELDGARLVVRVGGLTREITLQRVSESELTAKVAIPWRERPRNMADLSIEFIHDRA